ncbi:hypothetical protein ROZALSC1DRAFT_7345, partial [Rozella allomycis CSF55]
VGMRFAPDKCVYIFRTNLNLKLYNEPLSRVDTAVYLGMPFNAFGIDWMSHVKARSEKAKRTACMLSTCGFNGSGWPISASVNVYKTFVRPQLEYGLSLSMIPIAARDVLQKAQ